MYGNNCRAQHLVEFGVSFAVDNGIACAQGFKQLCFHGIAAQAAHHQHDGEGLRRRGHWQMFMPIGSNSTPIFVYRVDVTRQTATFKMRFEKRQRVGI